MGAACGAVGSALCNPLDLVKTRLQRDADRYANSLHALVEIPRAAGFGATTARPLRTQTESIGHTNV